MWLIRDAAFFGSLAVLSFVCVPLFAHAQQEYALLTPDAIIQLTNTERSAEALVQYRENRVLAATAEEKAKDMAKRSYFAHVTPEGEKTWNLVRERGYHFSRVGENLAVKFSDPDRVVSMWMASPGHRANLLNEKFVDIGVGIAEGVYQGATTTFVVALYAAPLEAQSNEAGEVKGEREPSQESAGLMASLEPESPEPDKVIVKTDELKVVALEEIAPLQAAVASAGPFESFRSAFASLLEVWRGLFR